MDQRIKLILAKERSYRAFFCHRNYQRTAGDIVVPIAEPVVVDIRQPAVIAIAAVEPVRVLKICFNSSIITGDSLF